MIASRIVVSLVLAVAFAVGSCCRARATDHRVAAGPAFAVIAQLTLPTAAPAPAVSGLAVQGLFVTAPIVLDGVSLFRIGSPINPPITQLPITMRVANVQTSLAQLLAETGSGSSTTTVIDPKTLRVHVKREGDVAVLEAVDAKHTDPLPLITVTSIDARSNGTNVDALAAQWQSTLQSALVRALDLRQPAAEKRSLRQVTNVAVGLVVISLLVFIWLRFLWRRIEELEGELAERSAAATAEAPLAPEQPAASERRRRFFALSLRSLEPARRQTIYGAVAETLVWGTLLAWFVAITWGLSLFAETTPLAQTIAHGALGVAATIIVTGLLNRILDIAIGRAAAAWRVRRFGSSDDRARLLLRIPTIAHTLAGTKTFVLVFIAVLTIFGQIGVPIGSVVTIGGLTAIALSLAAQNFVRDFLNGFLVLYEDQYVVGDYVTINAFSGSVELLTLRMVQIRDAAGDLITIPHSSVINVVNQSRNWSRVDYRVPVDPVADIAKAIEIVRTEVEALASQGDWTHDIRSPLEWIGIDALSKDAVIIRASIKTAPLRQFELRRQINERVHAALGHAGITLGAPLPP
jgi:small-conductance mechanosensitive channel